jgi:hypothetical protein
MTYLALLPGVNVGGKNKVEMARLRDVFESIGATDVRTYINSGNVIFKHDRPPARLRAAIENAIGAEFGCDVRIVLRDRDQVMSPRQGDPRLMERGLHDEVLPTAGVFVVILADPDNAGPPTSSVLPRSHGVISSTRVSACRLRVGEAMLSRYDCTAESTLVTRLTMYGSQ